MCRGVCWLMMKKVSREGARSPNVWLSREEIREESMSRCCTEEWKKVSGSMLVRKEELARKKYLSVELLKAKEGSVMMGLWERSRRVRSSAVKVASSRKTILLKRRSSFLSLGKSAKASLLMVLMPHLRSDNSRRSLKREKLERSISPSWCSVCLERSSSVVEEKEEEEEEGEGEEEEEEASYSRPPTLRKRVLEGISRGSL